MIRDTLYTYCAFGVVKSPQVNYSCLPYSHRIINQRHLNYLTAVIVTLTDQVFHCPQKQSNIHRLKERLNWRGEFRKKVAVKWGSSVISVTNKRGCWEFLQMIRRWNDLWIKFSSCTCRDLANKRFNLVRFNKGNY